MCADGRTRRRELMIARTPTPVAGGDDSGWIDLIVAILDGRWVKAHVSVRLDLFQL